MNKLDYILPAPQLCDYISLYYWFESDAPRAYDRERAAIAQLRFIMCGRGIMHFANGSNHACEGPMVVGPTSGAVEFEVEGPFRMFGLGLLAAGWDALTQASAADYVDRAVPAIELFPNIRERVAGLQHADGLDGIAEAANSLLAPFMAAASPETLAFTRMVDGWLASSVSPSVGELHAMVALSERQVTRRVKQLYGMPPKYLARKYRALRAARALVEADPAEADFLRDAFYDQSHMIREMRLFTGTTPSKLRKNEGDLATMIDRRGRFVGRISALTAET